MLVVSYYFGLIHCCSNLVLCLNNSIKLCSRSPVWMVIIDLEKFVALGTIGEDHLGYWHHLLVGRRDMVSRVINWVRYLHLPRESRP